MRTRLKPPAEPEATAALDALAKATTTVKLAADDARAAVAKLPDGTHG